MLDPKIAISGASSGLPSEEGEELGYKIGKLIAARGGILLTGATTGVPHAAARGAKSVQGQTIGFSPAHSLLEHTRKYRLPITHHDLIFFTGYDYPGRDIVLVDLADAIVMVSGRIGSLHEFAFAFERNKIIGILLHSGGTSEDIPNILEHAKRGKGKVIMQADPEELINLVFAALADNGF